MVINNINNPWHNYVVNKTTRAKQKNQIPCVIWFTGLSGSGKSTVAGKLEEVLTLNGYHTYLLDGDNMRHGLNRDLGFLDADRVENIRRVGEVSKLFVDAGLIVLTAFISPFKSDRNMVKDLLSTNEFVEVFMNTSLEICEKRDPKGLYEKARKGEIKNFTGIDSNYEIPDSPSIILNTEKQDVMSCVQQIINYLISNKIISNKLASIN